jgi:pimeloyl-ACP methyl ester carboxylesterase
MHFMQIPGLAEKLVVGRQAEYLGYFLKFGKFTPGEVSHYVQAYATPAQLHAAFEMYRAFPANVQFNQAQRGPNEVPVFLAAGAGSPFAKLVPQIAEGLRGSGLTRVETGRIPDSIHYVVADQPEAVADLIERYASLRAA